jgi:hypothetical protein
LFLAKTALVSFFSVYAGTAFFVFTARRLNFRLTIFPIERFNPIREQNLNAVFGFPLGCAIGMLTRR